MVARINNMQDKNMNSLEEDLVFYSVDYCVQAVNMDYLVFAVINLSTVLVWL